MEQCMIRVGITGAKRVELSVAVPGADGSKMIGDRVLFEPEVSGQGENEVVIEGWTRNDFSLTDVRRFCLTYRELLKECTVCFECHIPGYNVLKEYKVKEGQILCRAVFEEDPLWESLAEDKEDELYRALACAPWETLIDSTRETLITVLYKDALNSNGGEVMDGDATEEYVAKLLIELNKFMGNK